MQKNRLILGDGPEKVFVISQLSQTPPCRRFFFETFRPFLRQYTFTIADCLEPGLKEKLDGAIAYWKNELSKSDCHIFMGFSLGGCLLQPLTEIADFADKKFIFISSCTHITKNLRNKLETVISALKARQTSKALATLNSLVGLPGNQDTRNLNLETARNRMLTGFGWILDHDGRDHLVKRKAKVLFLVGAKSNLITKKEIAKEIGIKLAIVEHARMRIMTENSMACKKIINTFLEGSSHAKVLGL